MALVYLMLASNVVDVDRYGNAITHY